MKKIIVIILVISIGVVAGDEGILPSKLTVDLPKKCQMLMLHEKPDIKSKKKFTSASYGDKIENMGCIREVTQKEIDAIPKEKRDYFSFSHPVWCHVAVGDKKGWVLQKYLKNEFLDEEMD